MESMARDSQALFQEEWEYAAKRVDTGKHSKDRIRFFLTDGTTKTFDIPPMRDDQMKEDFLTTTIKAINNHHVEAILLTYEAWFLDEGKKVTEAELDAYLKNTLRPQDNPRRREGVNFYYESNDGTMVTALAEIITIKKNKRKLAKLFPITVVNSVETRMSHFFKKAKEYSRTHLNITDEII
jgi:hypothetical protein